MEEEEGENEDEDEDETENEKEKGEGEEKCGDVQEVELCVVEGSNGKVERRVEWEEVGKWEVWESGGRRDEKWKRWIKECDAVEMS